MDDLVRAGLPDDLDVTVLSVADVYLPPEPPAPPPDVPSPLVRKARDKARRELESQRGIAAQGCARLRQLFPKWSCTSVAVADSPGWAIIKQATETKADLIVLGSKSHSRLQRFFLGSVAHKVAAEAPCSVRIARQSADADPSRIIVAVDGSADSKTALQAVAARRWSPGTQFRLVTAVDPRMETVITWPEFLPAQFVQNSDENEREWITRMMEAAARILSDAGLEVSNHMHDGDAKDVLLRVSDEWKAGAIFIGARGLQHGNRLYVGTVASSVASRAHCSVEIVRPIHTAR